MLSNADFLRYSRQLMLPVCGEAGIKRLQRSHVVVIGAGGLGSISAAYLAAAGVGQLTIIDDDCVELSNLPRQWLYQAVDVGAPKADCLAAALETINTDTNVRAIKHRFELSNAATIIDQADLLLDCTDNLATRQHINEFCLNTHLPWVFAAAIGFQSHCMALHPSRIKAAEHGCLHCLYPFNELPAGRCTEQGVLGPAVGLAASMQASLALRALWQDPQLPWGQLWQSDQLSFAHHTLQVPNDSGCTVCHRHLTHDVIEELGA